MCRLSVLYRRPLHEVASWPAGHVRLLEHYLSRQPAPDERLGVAMATLTAMYMNAHQKEGATAKGPADFMPYLACPWDRDETEKELSDDLRRE